MYTRFVTSDRDCDSHCLEGVFCAIYRLRNSGKVRTHDIHELTSLVDWFKDELPVPKCLLNPGAERAICWFRPEASLMLRQGERIRRLLHRYAIQTYRIRSRHPGDAIYRDKWQVVAKPWRGRRSPRF